MPETSLTYQLPLMPEGKGSSKQTVMAGSPLLWPILNQEEQMDRFCCGSDISFTPTNPADRSQQWVNAREIQMQMFVPYLSLLVSKYPSLPFSCGDCSNCMVKVDCDVSSLTKPIVLHNGDMTFDLSMSSSEGANNVPHYSASDSDGNLIQPDLIRRTRLSNRWLNTSGTSIQAMWESAHFLAKKPKMCPND